jgi:lysophospholipase L1-like esterase
MGSSLPPFGSFSPVSDSGNTVSRPLSNWLSDTSRRRNWPMEAALANVMPIMAAPPTTSLNKGSGISTVAPSAAGTGYAVGDQITLAAGTYTTAGIVEVSGIGSGGSITSAYVILPGVYQTNPTNPVAQSSTTGSGTGATFTLGFNAGVMTTCTNAVYWARAVSNGTYRYTGYSLGDVTSGYLGSVANNGVATLVEWESDEAHFDIKLTGNNSLYMLFIRVNGQWQRISSAGFSTDASGAPYLLTVDWAGVFQPRAYKLVGVNTAFGGIYTNSTGSVWYPGEPRKPLGLIFGDSYTYGTDASSPAAANCCIAYAALGLEVLANGIGGSGWNTTGSNAALTRVQSILSTLQVSTPQGTAIPIVPQYVQLDLGYNDAGSSMTTLSSTMVACVQAIQAAWPTTKIWAMGPATPLGMTTNLGLVRTAVMAVAAQFNLPFIDVLNFVTSANHGRYTSASDNTHPNGDAGNEYLAGRKAPLISAIL